MLGELVLEALRQAGMTHIERRKPAEVAGGAEEAAETARKQLQSATENDDPKREVLVKLSNGSIEIKPSRNRSVVRVMG